MLQYRVRTLNGKYSKWKWFKKFSSTADAYEVEMKFMDYYNDWIGTSRMSDLSDSYRIKTFDINLPKIKQ